MRRLIRLLIERLEKQPSAAGISTGCDALTSLGFAAEAIGAAPDGLVPFTIHGEAFEEAGATAVEEVGFTLAAGVDFWPRSRSAESQRIARRQRLNSALLSDRIISFRLPSCARSAWSGRARWRALAACAEAARARIAARTSRWNKTVYDPHVNILRGTTEAMAAALGGADLVTVAPFDACYKEPDEASRRLARNTQLLLKHEAWLGRVADAGGGSYYVEAMTDPLAGEGWKLMQEIEARGGFRKAQAGGSDCAGAGAVDGGAREGCCVAAPRICGNESICESRRAGAGPRRRRTDECRPRGARMYEELRLRTERHAAAGGKTPRVLLAEIGDVKMRVARANFAANFFACAGFEAARKRFRNAREIAAADGDLIVLCGADPEYAALAAELMPKLKSLGRSTPVIVAGNPPERSSLRRRGLRTSYMCAAIRWKC